MASESPVDAFVRGKAWAEQVVQLQREVVHGLVDEHLGPLQPQPTQHAADGVLRVQGPEGKMALDMSTHSGGAVWHKHTTVGTVSMINMLYTKTSVSACAELLTPFLDVEVGGTEKSVLMSIFFSPRLCLLRHLDYTRKYYRTVPPGATGLSDFNTLYNRMLDRTPANADLVTIGTQAADGDAAKAPLYRVFSSKQLWTRLQGHGALFNFDPRDDKAWEAVRQDAGGLVKLWCAWAKADWEASQGPGADTVRPGPKVLDEWRDRSRIMLTQMDLDEDVSRSERLLGAEVMVKVRETVSGVASLAPRPTWL